MFLPVLLLAIAIFSAAFTAYGTESSWAAMPHGMEIIYLARRLQWPLLAMSLVMCLIVLALVVSGKRRGWWLLGLAPVLTLFAHRFSTNPLGALRVADNPATVAADQADFLRDDDYVVGVTVDGSAYAYPYRQLFLTPVVFQNDFDKRFMLIWSAYANRAVVMRVDRDCRARDLEIVSMPANALLLYNTRYGQFINGVTGMTSTGSTPYGFRKPLASVKMTWKKWRAANPSSQVMLPTRTDIERLPAAPVKPLYALPPTSQPSDLRVVFVPATQPIALLEDQIPPRPVNLSAGSTPVLVYRDPITSAIRAFERKIDVDLFPRFLAASDPKRPNLFMVDADTNTAWSAAGVAIDGEKTRKNQRLAPLMADRDLPFNVMKFWYPSLELAIVPPEPPAVVAPPASVEPQTPKPAPVKRRQRRAR